MSTPDYHHEQKPVNFGDFYSPPNYDPYADTRTRTEDTESVYTHATSGIVALDNSGRKNELGQTEAEAVAHSYRSSPTNDADSKTSGAVSALDRRTSTFSQNRKSMAPSNADALTYIDEDFNYYSSRKDTPSGDKMDDPLVQNAADMGRTDRTRSMSELGEGHVFSFMSLHLIPSVRISGPLQEWVRCASEGRVCIPEIFWRQISFGATDRK